MNIFFTKTVLVEVKLKEADKPFILSVDSTRNVTELVGESVEPGIDELVDILLHDNRWMSPGITLTSKLESTENDPSVEYVRSYRLFDGGI